MDAQTTEMFFREVGRFNWKEKIVGKKCHLRGVGATSNGKSPISIFLYGFPNN